MAFVLRHALARRLLPVLVAALGAACAKNEGPVAPGTAEPAAAAPASATSTVEERGAHLVLVLDCDACHSPKVLVDGVPQPDPARRLSGHPADRAMPAIPAGLSDPSGWVAVTNADGTVWAGPWGVSYAINLTPDPSGLGSWTEENFVQAIRTGRHLGVARPILPPMPWPAYSNLSDEDLRAVFAYLRTVPAVANVVPEPVPPAPPGI